jgi:hypothetical protein
LLDESYANVLYMNVLAGSGYGSASRFSIKCETLLPESRSFVKCTR